MAIIIIVAFHVETKKWPLGGISLAVRIISQNSKWIPNNNKYQLIHYPIELRLKLIHMLSETKIHGYLFPIENI